MPEIKLPVAPVEEIKQARADEIVALRCVAKIKLDESGRPLRDGNGEVQLWDVPNGTHIDVQKAGTRPATLYINNWMRVKRSDTEWHVSKMLRSDVRLPLMLEIVPLDEMLAKPHAGDRTTPADSEREILTAKLLKTGVITRPDEVNGLDMAGLRELAGQK